MEAFCPQEKSFKKLPSFEERPSPHPRGHRQPRGPAVVASSGSDWARLEMVPTCENTGREEGNSEVVFVTFVLLFFMVAILQVLNNWPPEGYHCEVRSYIDVSAFPARLGFTEEVADIRHHFPGGVRNGAEIFPVAQPEQIHPKEAGSSPQKLTHARMLQQGFSVVNNCRETGETEKARKSAWRANSGGRALEKGYF